MYAFNILPCLRIESVYWISCNRTNILYKDTKTKSTTANNFVHETTDSQTSAKYSNKLFGAIICNYGERLFIQVDFIFNSKLIECFNFRDSLIQQRKQPTSEFVLTAI